MAHLQALRLPSTAWRHTVTKYQSPKHDGVLNKMGAPQCMARKRDGERCGMPARKMLTVCKRHGGNTSPGAQASERRVAEVDVKEKAERFLYKLGLNGDVTPEQALLDLVRRSAGMVNYYEMQLAQFVDRPGELVWTKVREDAQVGVAYAAEANVWLSLYDKERDRLAKVSDMALSAGIAERRIQLEEEAGRRFGTAVQEILDHMLNTVLAELPTAARLSVTDAWAQGVSDIVPKALRALEAA